MTSCSASVILTAGALDPPGWAEAHCTPRAKRHSPRMDSAPSGFARLEIDLHGRRSFLNGKDGFGGFEMGDLHPDIHVIAALDPALPAGTADIQPSARFHR